VEWYAHFFFRNKYIKVDEKGYHIFAILWKGFYCHEMISTSWIGSLNVFRQLKLWATTGFHH